MAKKRKAPTAEFLRKYGIPTALVPGIIIAASLGFNWEKIIEKNPRNNQEIFATNLVVQDVLDGDTIKLSKGMPIRLIGMNAPDKGQPYYNESRAFLVKLIGNKKVKVEYARAQNDNYGRLRGYAFVTCDYPNQKFCQNGELNLNQAIIGEGLAKTKQTKLWNDNKYKLKFQKAEQQAKQNHLNLWSN
jgi:micrococcal nuclease